MRDNGVHSIHDGEHCMLINMWHTTWWMIKLSISAIRLTWNLRSICLISIWTSLCSNNKESYCVHRMLLEYDQSRFIPHIFRLQMISANCWIEKHDEYSDSALFLIRRNLAIDKDSPEAISKKLNNEKSIMQKLKCELIVGYCCYFDFREFIECLNAMKSLARWLSETARWNSIQFIIALVDDS